MHVNTILLVNKHILHYAINNKLGDSAKTYNMHLFYASPISKQVAILSNLEKNLSNQVKKRR